MTTVLIIEDDISLLRLNKELLKRFGYQTLEANTGNEAVSLAQTHEGDIDVALLDLGLPDMAASKVFREITRAKPGMKIIICSGEDHNGAVQKFMDKGATGFLQKPYSLSTFAAEFDKL